MGNKGVDRQLELFNSQAAGPALRTAAARHLADALASLLSEPVHLTVHDNRSTMLSFRRKVGQVHYRVHHMFLEAPQEVVRALAAFAGGNRGKASRRRQAGSRIDAFVRMHRERIAVSRPVRLDPRGRHHDLQAIFDELNATSFANAIQARIGWGTWRGGRRRRSIKTGVYVHDAKLIRIHPTLDRPDVPRFYVAAVVYHEMLHQAVPIVEVNGRRVVHGPQFRQREQAYPDHERAKQWEQEHLRLLLSPPA